MVSMIEWAVSTLTACQYRINNSSPETIQDTPWSQIYRFSTDRGFVFLKKVPPALFIEAKIIQVLRQAFQAKVPQVLAADAELHCFLMPDAGVSLHEYFKEKFQAEVLIRALNDYTALQIQTMGQVQPLLDLGLPDWGLAKLPSLFHDLISQETLLREDGLTAEAIKKLRNSEAKLLALCERLAAYRLKDAFGHADFHDKNILIKIDTQQTTMIDLGEVVVTHPFFSLLNCLHRAKENFNLSQDEYRQLQMACLQPWLALETQEHLDDIMAIMQQCWPIHSALGEYRLMKSVDPIAFQELRRQGRLKRNLEHWIGL